MVGPAGRGALVVGGAGVVARIGQGVVVEGYLMSGPERFQQVQPVYGVHMPGVQLHRLGRGVGGRDAGPSGAGWAERARSVTGRQLSHDVAELVVLGRADVPAGLSCIRRATVDVDVGDAGAAERGRGERVRGDL